MGFPESGKIASFFQFFAAHFHFLASILPNFTLLYKFCPKFYNFILSLPSFANFLTDFGKS